MSVTATIDKPIPIPASEAKHVARDFVSVLSDVCERVVVAGSLRRQKPYVKDVEILFVPKFASSAPGAMQIRADFFITPSKPPPINLAEQAIQSLLDAGLVAPRPNVNGVEAWGLKNKLAIHVPSDRYWSRLGGGSSGGRD